MPANILIAAASGAPAPGMILPFAAMLLAIALMPFIHKHWWEIHYPKVAAGLGAITFGYYVFVLGNAARMGHVAHEYISFMALIASLFIVSGGIHFGVKAGARPWLNCVFLLIGAVLANLVGTTGASMLLIRPWIRMNQARVTAFHIVFFIFIVSNVGGCLTPIGDPPLFLGYLKGVPFWWVFQKCWAAWTLMIMALIAIFYAFDRRNYNRSQAPLLPGESTGNQWTFDGFRNVAFLGLILAAVFIKQPLGLSESLMAAAAVGSYFSTPRRVHQANEFNFAPIREVAWLFAGIFATMAPALDYLQSSAAKLGMDTEAKFYWSTGLLSAGLDNAPTYLTFLAVAMGKLQLNLNQASDVADFVAHHDHELIAISLGAVFFGAMTYIGNGPNFMVKSIAERARVEVPSFFAFILKYAMPILLPLLFLVSILFFSPWRIF